MRFNKIILFLNIFFSLFLLIIYISIELNPIKYGYLSLLSLLYSPILLINIIFVFYWLVIKKIYFLLSMIIVLIGYNHLQKQVQVFGKKINNSKNSIKIISFNTRSFVNNGWENINRKKTKNNLFNKLNNEKADIICLQEFPDTIDVNLNYNLYQDLGTIILTNKKIINSHSISLVSNRSNSCIYVDLIIDQDTLRVYNMHLESIQINEKDNFIKKIQKIKEGNIIRIKQIETIKNDLKNSPYPTIICGDMNTSPYSLSYKKMKKNLNDAFVESGYGLGNTFKYIIPLRIDYIFHQKNINSYNFKTIYTDISDHNMIKCNIIIN